MKALVKKTIIGMAVVMNTAYAFDFFNTSYDEQHKLDGVDKLNDSCKRSAEYEASQSCKSNGQHLKNYKYNSSSKDADLCYGLVEYSCKDDRETQKRKNSISFNGNVYPSYNSCKKAAESYAFQLCGERSMRVDDWDYTRAPNDGSKCFGYLEYSCK